MAPAGKRERAGLAAGGAYDPMPPITAIWRVAHKLLGSSVNFSSAEQRLAPIVLVFFGRIMRSLSACSALKVRTMTRYYFNTPSEAGGNDTDGTELPDIASVKVAAVELAGSILKEGAAEFWDREDWNLDVTNADGLILFRLTVFATMAAASWSCRQLDTLISPPT